MKRKYEFSTDRVNLVRRPSELLQTCPIARSGCIHAGAQQRSSTAPVVRSIDPVQTGKSGRGWEHGAFRRIFENTLHHLGHMFETAQKFVLTDFCALSCSHGVPPARSRTLMSGAATGADGWVRVGGVDALGARTTLKVHGRKVAVLRLRRRGTRELRWTCFDAVCYHAGGPLHAGAIVRAAGRTCVQCPWHMYLIDAFTGEGVYKDMGGEWRSKGAKQRTHDIEARDDGMVYVRLRDGGGALPSDDYAFDSVLDSALEAETR